MSEKKRAVIVGSVCASVFAAAAAVFLIQSFAPAGNTVRIVSCGRVVDIVDLSASPDRVFTIESEYGSNTVKIENHRICVSEADCADNTCVKTGFLGGGTPIICLPHKLVIEYTAESGEADFGVR